MILKSRLLVIEHRQAELWVFASFFEKPLAELQAGHRDFLHTASRATSASGLADLAAERAPLGPAARSGVEDTAELSLRMVSCKSALSFPSVLIFFHGFFPPLLVWHAYICLISLNLAPRLAGFPVFKQKGISPSIYLSFNWACHYDIIPDFEIFYDIHCKLTVFYMFLLVLGISFH